jgi:hypothetical protein
MAKSLIEKNKYSIGMFVLFTALLLLKMPGIDDLSSFTTTIYTTSYDLGFSSRFLVGSLVFLFTDFLTRKALYAIIVVSTVVMTAFASYMLGYVPGRLDGDAGSGARAIMLLYAAVPISIIVLYKDNNFGRYDIYLITVSLLILVCLAKRRLRWIVPALCAVCMLIHHVWMFSFMPAAAILLLYSAFRDKKRRAGVALCALSYAVIIGLFLYFQFFKPILRFASAEEMAAELGLRTDFLLNPSIFYGEYFSSVPELWNGYIRQILLEDSIPDALYLLPVVLPVLALLFSVWINAFRLCSEKFMRFVILLCMAAPLSTLVQCIMINDYGRWFAGMMITQISLMFFLLYKKEESVTEAAGRLAVFFKKRPYIAAAVAAYVPMFVFSSSYNL